VTFAASQEGGYIFPDFLPAYDAVATFINLLALLAETGLKLSKVVSQQPRIHIVHETVVTPWEQKGMVMRTLVERAGGLTPNAYLYGSVFTRESTRVLQQRRMDEAVHTMILQMQRGNLALAASPVTNQGDLAGLNSAQASERELVAQLQQQRATGRIVFSFVPESNSTDSIPNVPLENGDVFLIPSKPSTVNAVGAIFNQNSFLYEPDARVDSYLQLAGGTNPDADSKHMLLVRANGAVVSRESLSTPWGNDFMHLKLNPGDTIVVPDKTLKPSALRGVLDWTQILSQMALSIAAFTVVF